MSTVKETVAVTNPSGDVLVIAHHREMTDGMVMDDTFVLSKSSAGWLADHVVQAFAPDGSPPYQGQLAPDTFSVMLGGPDYQPCVNVTNRRDKSVERGGVFAMSGLTEPAANQLAAELRALAA